MQEVQIGYPIDTDWDWIIERHTETAWASVIPEIRRHISIQVVRDNLAEQTAKLRADHGRTNQVFIARSNDGIEVGYIWVGQITSAFTGSMQAYIFNIFVEDGFRGHGIGARLMALADTWAHQNGFERIGLSVAVNNESAIELYKNLGYKVETIRMFKNL